MKHLLVLSIATLIMCSCFSKKPAKIYSSKSNEPIEIELKTDTVYIENENGDIEMRIIKRKEKK